MIISSSSSIQVVIVNPDSMCDSIELGREARYMIESHFDLASRLFHTSGSSTARVLMALFVAPSLWRQDSMVCERMTRYRQPGNRSASQERRFTDMTPPLFEIVSRIDYHSPDEFQPFDSLPNRLWWIAKLGTAVNGNSPLMLQITFHFTLGRRATCKVKVGVLHHANASYFTVLTVLKPFA